MTAAVVTLAVLAVAAAGTATALVIRNGRLHKDIGKLNTRIARLLVARERDAESIETINAELATVRSRLIAVDQDRAREIHALEQRYAEIARVCRDPDVVTDYLGDVLAESEAP